MSLSRASTSNLFESSVKIIPVIDLLDAHVVRGVAGNRSQYRPIESPLCATSNPLDVVAAFLRLGSFDTIYVADLNALQKNGNATPHIISLLEAFPAVNFWVDAGFDSAERLAAYLSFSTFIPIIASETLTSLAQYRELTAGLASRQHVLSLDHADEPLGPAALFSEPGLWPHQVIIMTLNNVGRAEGPDFKRIAHYQALDQNRQFIAAGGVRDNRDLAELRIQGVDAVLVASALHSGKIDTN